MSWRSPRLHQDPQARRNRARAASAGQPVDDGLLQRGDAAGRIGPVDGARAHPSSAEAPVLQ
ncbi:MAG: hypothetical protein WKF75_01585 [Singulisphaera sp.]